MEHTTDEPAHEAGGYAFAERVTGLCRGTLYALVHERRIPHVRLSPRLVRFRRADLDRWMAERAVPVGGERAR